MRSISVGGDDPGGRRPSRRLQEVGAGPESATTMLCRLQDQAEDLLRAGRDNATQVENAIGSLHAIVDKMDRGFDEVEAAIEAGNRNTELLTGAVQQLITVMGEVRDELRRR